LCGQLLGTGTLILALALLNIDDNAGLWEQDWQQCVRKLSSAQAESLLCDVVACSCLLASLQDVAAWLQCCMLMSVCLLQVRQ
jgi:hypothetical protein